MRHKVNDTYIVTDNTIGDMIDMVTYKIADSAYDKRLVNKAYKQYLAICDSETYDGKPIHNLANTYSHSSPAKRQAWDYWCTRLAHCRVVWHNSSAYGLGGMLTIDGRQYLCYVTRKLKYIMEI